MEQVYWAIAKDVIKRDTVFSCVFPCRVYAHSGDRVSCVDNKGQTVIGDIIYADYCTKDSREIPELVDALEYLAEDYDHPNGFNLINALNNQLKTE